MTADAFHHSTPSAFPDVLYEVGLKWSLKGAALPRRLLWGVAPTGPPHLGYVPHLLTSRRLQRAGCHTILLVADFHAYLDDEKAAWEELEVNSARYIADLAPSFSEVRRAAVDYLVPAYFEGLIRMSSRVPAQIALDAGDGTLRLALADRKVADILYTAMQMYDLEYYDVDFALCGRDEAPIYEGAFAAIPGLGSSTSYAYLPVCPGVESDEMHASDSQSNKILLTASEAEVQESLSRHVEVHAVPWWACPLPTYLNESIVPLVIDLYPELSQLLTNGRAGSVVELGTLTAAALEQLRS